MIFFCMIFGTSGSDYQSIKLHGGIEFEKATSMKIYPDSMGYFTDCRQNNHNYRSQECAKIYSPTPNNYEYVLKKVCRGEDGRVRVKNPEKWPYCIHGEIKVHFSEDPGDYLSASGFLVGPHHFLTCAHVLKELKTLKEPKSIIVSFGLDKENPEAQPLAKLGQVSGIGFHLFSEWSQNNNPKFDIALVILKRSIGNDIGWAGLLSANEERLSSMTVEVTGYSAALEEKKGTMWTMQHKLKKVQEDYLTYLIDTDEGQSGGAIWFNNFDNPFVVGVHSRGIEDRENIGIRLTKSILQRIVRWIDDTAQIIESKQ